MAQKKKKSEKVDKRYKAKVRVGIAADIRARHKGNALFFHDFPFSVHNLLFQLHIGYSVHQQSADTIRALKNRDGMSSLVQLVGCCQTGGTAAHNGNILSRTHFGRVG